MKGNGDHECRYFNPRRLTVKGKKDIPVIKQHRLKEWERYDCVPNRGN